MRRELLVFGRAALDYDIGNLAWVIGDTMRTDDDHARHSVQDVNEGGNRDRATRILDLAFSEVCETLYPFCKRPVTADRGYLNSLDDTEGYVLELLVPSDFSSTTLALLKNLIHEYAVVSVLEDWTGLTAPESVEKWRLRKQEILLSIRDNLGGRMRKRRRTPSVF